MNQARFFQYLQFEKRFSPHTLTAYKKDMGQFKDFLENTYSITDPAEVHHTHIRSWMVDLMEKGNVPRSINRKLSCLTSYFKFLRKHGEIKANPMTKVVPPKMGKRLPVYVKEENMSLLFGQVDFGSGFPGLRDRLILEMLYCTGMRRSELSGVKISDVDLATFQVKVFGKRQKERLIPIARHLAQSIEQYLAARRAAFPGNDCPALLLNDKGEALGPSSIYAKVKRYLSLVTTVEQRSPHVLRHTFATHLSNNGADLNAIKALLGHSSLAATQVYTHNSMEQIKKAYQQAHPKAKLPLEPGSGSLP